jgi:hypothetical protein
LVHYNAHYEEDDQAGVVQHEGRDGLEDGHDQVLRGS